MKNAVPFTEADIEARMLKPFCQVFPWIKPADIRVQKSLTFQLGHKKYKVDGFAHFKVSGRADAIIYNNDSPIAIVELKKPGYTLTEEDFSQGQSYARFLTPQPPLVIISNGKETQLRSSFDGKTLSSSTVDSTELERMINTAFLLTQNQLNDAISTLLGPNLTIWHRAVRDLSSDSLKRLTGPTWDGGFPIANDFQISREATSNILGALRKHKKVVILQGAPLSGKTNVLSQLVQQTADSNEFAVLYLDLHHSTDSIFQVVADILNAEFGWPATELEARRWLQNLSNKQGAPALVVALDGIGSSSPHFVKEVETLASAQFGGNLRIVLSVFESDSEQLRYTTDRRTPTKIGRNAEQILLSHLSDEEFTKMADDLAKQDLVITHGSEKSIEWRQPWIARTIVGKGVQSRASLGSNFGILLPPFLGIALLTQVAKMFAMASEVRAQYGELAKAAIKSVTNGVGPPHQEIEFISNFVLSEESLEAHFDKSQLEDMRSNGYLRKEYRGSGKTTYVPRLPELLASEIADQLAERLSSHMESESELCVKQLLMISNGMPFGPVIAASALNKAALRNNGIPGELIQLLLERPPRKESISIGSTFLTYIDGKTVKVQLLEGKKLQLINEQGHQITIEPMKIPTLGTHWLI